MNSPTFHQFRTDELAEWIAHARTMRRILGEAGDGEGWERIHANIQAARAELSRRIGGDGLNSAHSTMAQRRRDWGAA